MSKTSATVHLTKRAAAQRQLNAAIRMLLGNEDELAVHTVAAAAFHILKDIKKMERGRSELADSLNRGLFYTARNFATGKKLPDFLDETLTRAVHKTADAIKRGEINSKADVTYFKVHASAESSYWRKFNLAANFLKHADWDVKDTLELRQLENEKLIMAASASYCELMNEPTPEIVAFAAFVLDDEELIRFLPEGTAKKLRGSKPAARRRLCLKLSRDLTKALARTRERATL